jgi:hypothetical protein
VTKRQQRFKAYQIGIITGRIVKVEGELGEDMTDLVTKVLRDYRKLLEVGEQTSATGVVSG